METSIPVIALVKLLLAHFMGDFVLQPGSWVKDKEKRKIKSIKLYLHALVHGLLTWIFLWEWKYWSLALSVTIIHLGIDLLKVYLQKTRTKSYHFFIDQFLHIVSLLILWWIFFHPHIDIIALWDNPTIWIYATALVFITFVSGYIIRELLSPWTNEIEQKGNSLARAGQYIGILERLLVFVFVLTGKWEGIGFLLAAKSVFRFEELKNQKKTEYILIGTLLSFSLALATGLAVWYGVKH